MNGPEYRDPRLNLEYTNFLKNKIDGEKFWVKYISGDNSLIQETRWDLFEDAMLAYLQQTLIFNGDELSKINWHVFFGILIEQLGHPEDESSLNPTYPLPTSFTENLDLHIRYTGRKVRRQEWVTFIQNIGFRDYARRCVTEDLVEGSVLEAKFLEKLS